MFGKLFRVVLFALVVFAGSQFYRAQAQSPTATYLSPIPNSQYNPAGTTIAIRYGDVIDPNSITEQSFTVQGSISGYHLGKAVLADDQKTIIFKPNQPFYLGERVQVELNTGISSKSGKKFTKLSYAFSITKTDRLSPEILSATRSIIANEFGLGNMPAFKKNITPSQYVTTPSDFPQIQITTPANGVANGYIFVSNFIPAVFSGGTNPGSYLLIFDNNGEPIYYQKVPQTTAATDFKKLSNGLLAYFENGTYHLLDNHYTEARTINSVNGFPNLDLHDLLLLPNGDYMFLIYYPQIVDMSQYVTGGKSNATVFGVIIQEVDNHNNVVFQWNSFDYANIIQYTDSNQDLTAQSIDFMHSNALDLDSDGNILLSSRHLSEITKIDHSSGNIIWRLGGVKNQFTFLTDPSITDLPQFYYQHHIRLFSPGVVTLFDNHDNNPPTNSRGMKFALDEQNKTAKLIWEYRNTPDIFTSFMGNTQYLPNGNIMMGWGSNSNPNITEITPNGTKVFEAGFDTPYTSYRSLRFPWNGYPTWAPTLVAQQGTSSLQLTFSWNGATDIAKYDVYGSKLGQPIELITEVAKTGFETNVNLTGAQTNYLYYLVMPINTGGQVTIYSNTVTNPADSVRYFPLISINK